MKNLIKRAHFALYILLPVFVFCDAQAQVRDTLYQITCDGDTTGRYFVFERWQMPQELAMQNIVQLMFEYENECYKDSTKIQVNVNPDKNSSHNGITTLMYYPPIWEDMWIHKEPTFSEFVRWVRKK